jgi:hypothetical protein
MRIIGKCCLIVVAIVLASPAALSQTSEPDRWRFPLKFEGQLGGYLPGGMLSAALEGAPSRWLTVAGGLGLDPDEGLQGQSTVLLRAIVGNFAFGVGPGFGVGNHTEISCESAALVGCERVSSKAKWEPGWSYHLQGSAEVRWSSGFSLRVFGGVRKIPYGPTSYYNSTGCSPENCPPPLSAFMNYLGIGIGYAFEEQARALSTIRARER